MGEKFTKLDREVRSGGSGKWRKDEYGQNTLNEILKETMYIFLSYVLSSGVFMRQ